jgi:IS5 family transposase
LFNLSDEQMEFQLLDPMSFLRFTRLEDIEARWTTKHGKSYCGYKLSANAGKRYKLIRKLKVSTVSGHDTNHFENVLDDAHTRKGVS